MNRRYPLALSLLVIGIAIVNALANYFSWYYHFKWLDNPMHFLGGLWVAGTAVWAWQIYKKSAAPQSSLGVYMRHLGIATIAVLVVGGAWEVFEWALDQAANREWDAVDTGGDLIFDMIGAMVAAAYATFMGSSQG